MMNLTINPNIRRGILIVLCALLVLRASAQGAQPALADAMNSIGSVLNNRGAVSWTERFPSLLGLSYETTGNLKDVSANASACSLTWTSVYTTSEDDKLVETVLVKLEMLSSATMQPYSTYLQSQTEYKFEVSPEIYVVEIKTGAPLERQRSLYHKNKVKAETKPPNNQVVRIVFADEATANKFVDGVRAAANSCKASKAGP